MTRTIGQIGLFLGAALLLTGCGGAQQIRDSLGITQKGPDPFSALPRKPLEMPKAAEGLPTPTPGAPSRLETDPLMQARGVIGQQPNAAAPSSAEQALLVATQASTAAADRRTIDAEAVAARKGKYLLDSWFSRSRINAEALDAKAEAERLGLKLPVKNP